MRFSINTLGCKVNLCESDEISGILSGHGCLKVDHITGNPQICIINTCTVTSEADRKVRQLVRRIRKTNKKAKLVVTGCYTRGNRHLLKNTGADLIIDNEQKKDIYAMAIGILASMEKGNLAKDCSPAFRDPADTRSRPIVKIQDGCEQNCSYCVIPLVRGGYKSTPVDRVLRRIERLTFHGFEEVVLTGIHIGKYGRDMGDSCTLATLLERVFAKTGIKRIRISSLEINEFDEGLVDIMKKNRKRLAPHFHIPLQSGSNHILEKMGRPYDTLYFMKILEKVTGVFPDAAITTDVIVGFPGERDTDFEGSCNIAKKAGFSKLHVFRYSSRPGTEASRLGHPVSESVKNERSIILRKIGNTMRRGFLEENVGSRLMVVVETKDKREGILRGTSGNYIKVYSKTGPGHDSCRGKIIGIRAEKCYRDGLIGSIL